MDLLENKIISTEEDKEEKNKIEEEKNKIEEENNKIEEENNKKEEGKNKIEEENNKIEEENNKIEEDKNKIEEDKNKIEEENNKIEEAKNNEGKQDLGDEKDGNINENNNLFNININLNAQSNININKSEQNLKKEEIDNNNNIQEKQNNQENKIAKNQDKFANIPVYINSAKTLEINQMHVLIYFIRGKLVHKEILRTFNDFELYHQTLLDMWPCICVPRLSFKQSSGSSSISFPDVKTKLLNHFFKKLSESKELLNCEATKIFLGQDKNYNIKLSNLKMNNNYKEISERYFKIFTDYEVDKKKIDEKEIFIQKFIKLLEATYKRVVEIGKTIENEIFNIKKERDSLDFVTKMFLDLEKSMPNPKKYLNDINDVVNPLKSVSKIKYY